MRLTRRAALLHGTVATVMTMTQTEKAATALANDGESQPPPNYPKPAPPSDPSRLGLGIQRSMSLIATSTPQKNKRARILFYGQSITEQKWWQYVSDDLRKRFRYTDLSIENHAIGGFASQMLVRDAESALYPWYPDLVIFHVYGDHNEYENIIRRLRERTTADILLQTDHVTRDSDLTEETDPTKIQMKGEMWNSFMNYVHIPNVAKKYGAGIVDVRGGWKAYLKANNLKASDLLKDGVHLNDHGCWLMAELIKQYLVYRPELAATVVQDRQKTFVVGKDIQWKGDRLKLDFIGNRVDLDSSFYDRPVDVLIDGKKPSEWPELYAFTRSTVYPGTPWPGVMRVQHEKPVIVEEWTIQITEHTDDLKKFSFEVSGSKTGQDGKGTNTEKFVSNSGRIVIEPADWSLERSREFTKKPLPDGFRLTFKVIPLFMDSFSGRLSVDLTKDYMTMVAQGLPNGPHTLEVVSTTGQPVSISRVQVYKP